MADSELIAFDREWRDGDRERARQIAADYVAANRARFDAIADKNIEELVGLVGIARSEGREDARVLIDMWLLVAHAPQRIEGSAHVGGAAAVAMAEAILAQASQHKE